MAEVSRSIRDDCVMNWSASIFGYLFPHRQMTSLLARNLVTSSGLERQQKFCRTRVVGNSILPSSRAQSTVVEIPTRICASKIDNGTSERCKDRFAFVRTYQICLFE